MINDMLSRVRKASELMKSVSDDFEAIENKELAKIVNSPKREIKHSDININNMKSKFGEMFYGLLEPINGSLPENRRFSDGSSKHQGSSTPEGPCVFHRLGRMTKYSSRAYWYSDRDVFDKLKQEHVDLIVDGTRVRKDHQKVAQEFLDAKLEIEEKIGEVRNNTTSLALSQTYTATGLLYKKTVNNLKIPSISVNVEISKASIEGDQLLLHYNIDSSSLSKMNKIGISANYQQRNSMILPITSPLETLPNDYIDWNTKLIIVDLVKPFNDPKIDNHFNNSVQLKEEALKVLEDLEDKYSSRLIAQGMF